MAHVWVVYTTWDVKAGMFIDDATNIEYVMDRLPAAMELLARFEAYYDNFVCGHICLEAVTLGA